VHFAKTIRLAVLCALIAGSALLAQQTPVFHAGVDAIELDVTVVDKDGQPIRGLQQSDFTVLEEKSPRPIVAFDAVNVDPPVVPTAKWMRDVTPDVDTNSFENRRLFVIARRRKCGMGAAG